MPSMPRTFRPAGAPTRAHQRREYDAHRRTSAPWRKWYATREWKELRRRQLALEPNCRRCRKEGKLVPATVCDHVERHRGDRVRFFAGPFQSLCKGCHDGWKQRQEAREGR